MQVQRSLTLDKSWGGADATAVTVGTGGNVLVVGGISRLDDEDNLFSDEEVEDGDNVIVNEGGGGDG